VKLEVGPAGMVVGYGFGTVAGVVHGVISVRAGLPAGTASSPEPAFAFKDMLAPFRSISVPMLGLHLYVALVVNVDVLAASHFLAAHEAGMYGGAASIARIVLVGANPLLLVMFSRLASMNAARQDTRRTQLLGSALVLGCLALSMLIPVFGGELVLRGFLGDAYAQADEILLWQWGTSCLLIVQVFVAESMLATSTIRGGFLFVLPAVALVLCLMVWHDSALIIARTSLLVCATLGSAVFLLLWRWRTGQNA
jgi:O-antigen/teichoic acid export membrane protein